MVKCLKKIVCVILMIICSFNYIYIVDAKDPDTPTTHYYTPGFTPDQLTGKGGETTDIISIGSDILKVLGIISSAISIIAMIALGIKYMMGSLEEKAQYKKTLLPYFIGAMFVFGATLIPGIIYNWFN